MVSVAQLVELWIVAPAAAGSNPVAHPTSSSSPKKKTQTIGIAIGFLARISIAITIPIPK